MGTRPAGMLTKVGQAASSRGCNAETTARGAVLQVAISFARFLTGAYKRYNST